ncbi:DUF4192 domain-containing protein [Acidipropionibacterium jensenii]|uniref:DUF4192 domain-containing protein n=1 Tax=Acidipropionibacterium jensenii TaxID=1749 RepID=UPI00214C9962|nr:DUF4192 domain-containing protein [Acidipropionibacterium jensenii]
MRTPQQSTPPVRIRSVDQAISIIPHLLGYQPVEDLVVLVIDPGLVCTVRTDLEEVRTPSTMMSQLAPVSLRFPDAQLLMVAWTVDHQKGLGVLALADAMLGNERIIDAVTTDGQFWWSLYCDDPACHEQGHRVVVDEEVRAEAVFRGLGVLPDRQALAATVAGPDPGQLDADNDLLIETGQWAASLDLVGAGIEAFEIWRRILDGQAPIDRTDALRLGHLTQLDEIAGMQWYATTKEDARKEVDTWLEVIAHLPESMAARPLVLCGLAAWLLGDGALESCCLERAGQIDPDLIIFGALSVLQHNAVPPTAWDQIWRSPQMIARGVVADAPPEAGPLDLGFREAVGRAASARRARLRAASRSRSRKRSRSGGGRRR